MMPSRFDSVASIGYTKPTFTIKVRVVRLWHRPSYSYDKSADAAEGMYEFVLCDKEVINKFCSDKSSKMYFHINSIRFIERRDRGKHSKQMHEKVQK